jgi:hypothetical protein
MKAHDNAKEGGEMPARPPFSRRGQCVGEAFNFGCGTLKRIALLTFH